MDVREGLATTLGDDFVLGRELGGGGMSRVFLADDTRLGRTVVVKVLAPELAAGISAERFQREIRTVASLQQANIVPLLTAGDSNGLPYFTMPYVDGQSLRARLDGGPPLTIAQCLSILKDIARALGYAHEHGVVHRDIKPDNILLSRGTAEVTDFGIAKALDVARAAAGHGTLTGMGTSLGTPAYMSPEQAAGDPALDGRADIYAVGVLAFEMLTGRQPFTGTPQAVMAAHIGTAPPPIPPRADLPPSLSALVLKCLAKDPALRPQTADDLHRALDAIGPSDAERLLRTRARTRRVVMFTAGAAVLAAALWVGTAGMREARWIRNQGIPQLRQLIDLGQFESAFQLARRIDAAGGNDSVMVELWNRFSMPTEIHSSPEGAKIFRAGFDDTTRWTLLGTTPMRGLRLPFAWGRVRAELPGYRTQDGLIWTYHPDQGAAGILTQHFALDSSNAGDRDMVRIPGGTLSVFLVGMENVKPTTLRDYRMDRNEVTNRQYKAFVDAGGYRKREYWPAELTNAKSASTWESTVASFVDKTGRPGPATWEAGEYPADEADFPVGGVSWYEASAYAKFAGKSLPTVYHWARAAAVAAAAFVVPSSNFSGTGPRRVGSGAMSAYGVFDMAGNVREWCENVGEDGSRYILGGGWSDAPYGFTDGYAQPAMSRAPINGIRLVKYLQDDPGLALAKAPLPRDFRDYNKEQPASDAAYEAFRHVFDYDRRPLNARIEQRDTMQAEWIVERVSFDAAYGGERMRAYLYLPRGQAGPYQSVVYFPGSGVLYLPDSKGRRDEVPSFVVKSGRAFIMPILKSTYERSDELKSDMPDSTIFWRDHAVMWVQDMQRTLDYLSSRPDMDTSRFAYFGHSWGANFGAVNLAIESRFKTGVLLVAGLTMQRSRPEVDPFNYLRHVKVPVLMLNGKYDFFFPVESAQKPYFNGLGTPAANKRQIIYEGAHDVPRTELIAETLNWLDKYLGPVRR